MDNEFLKELNTYSIEELELIISTQVDLYSAEEMVLLKQRLNTLTKEYIKDHIPEEIICPKCDQLNPFQNDVCEYCGYTFDKAQYYDIDYYSSNNAVETEGKNEEAVSYTFQYVISLLIPLVGFIIGAIMLSDKNDERQLVGKKCIIAAVISIVFSTLIIKIVY